MNRSKADILSGELLLAMKMEEDPGPKMEELKQYSFSMLLEDLHNDASKKAFWINIYNAWFLILRKIKKTDKSRIYKIKEVCIAEKYFSLDDIEHGILRKYRWKFSLGYLPNIFSSALIKKLAVRKIDYRLHFALNCGAESCPPIAFYSAEKIDQQLDWATRSFLESETDVDPEKKEIHISRLFQWYKGDFGGSRGIRSILKQQVDINAAGHKLVYKPYSWDEVLDNFVDSQT